MHIVSAFSNFHYCLIDTFVDKYFQGSTNIMCKMALLA